MQLRFKKEMHKRIIFIELETTNFNRDENKLLDKFGEPRIVINKKYRGIFPVEIDRSIRTGFKVKVKFDGTGNNLSDAALAAEEFYEEIKEQMASKMDEIAMKEFEIIYESNSGLDTIKY